MNIKHFLVIAAVLLGGTACAPKQNKGFEVDTITTADGKQLDITFIQHGSLAFNYDDMWIYVDPVGEHADYPKMPKADVILVTHTHGDHFDRDAMMSLLKVETLVIGPPEAANEFPMVSVMKNGEKVRANPYLEVEAVPAYNTTEGRTQFHPKGRDNGYVLTLGGTRVYVAGDTENISEMQNLSDIDIAFLPVNQPYTMTPVQAADAARAIKPGILYPYHYGLTDTETDLGQLVSLLDGSGIEVRIRQMQ